MSDDHAKGLIEHMAGFWRLTSYKFETSDGNVAYPWGDDPVGIVMFDKNRRFSAQIMTRDRPKITFGPNTMDEIKSAYAGFISYFGTFDIDEEKGIIINHVEGSLNPDWVGGDQIRYYTFEDNRMTLRTPPVQINRKLDATGAINWIKE